MPYPSIEDLPDEVRLHLPLHAREIFRAAFNNAWANYEAASSEEHEEIAHKIAWAAVKRKYKKQGHTWIPL